MRHLSVVHRNFNDPQITQSRGMPLQAQATVLSKTAFTIPDNSSISSARSSRMRVIA